MKGASVTNLSRGDVEKVGTFYYCVQHTIDRTLVNGYQCLTHVVIFNCSLMMYGTVHV